MDWPLANTGSFIEMPRTFPRNKQPGDHNSHSNNNKSNPALLPTSFCCEEFERPHNYKYARC